MKKKKDGNVVETQKEVAKAFRVSVRTVGFWIQEGMPVPEAGGYDLDIIRQWKRLRQQARKSPSVEEKENSQARFHDIKANLLELQYKRQIGEVISLEDVKKEWIKRVLVVKQTLLALPRTLAPQVAGKDTKDCQNILDKRIREVITSFANT